MTEDKFQQEWLQMQRPRIQVLLLILVAIVAAFAVACGGDSGNRISPDPTLDPESRRATEEAKPTIDVVGNQADAPIREIERSLERLSVLVSRIDERIAKDISQSRGTSELTAEGWFVECCDEREEDFLDKLLDVEEQLQKLTAIYEEAADEPKSEIIRQLGTSLANINALARVLAGLPTSSGYVSVLDDISLELAAFSEAFAALG